MRALCTAALMFTMGCGEAGRARGDGVPEADAGRDAGTLGQAVADAGRACDAWREGPALLDQREGSPTFLLDDDRVLLVAGHFDNRTEQPINSSEVLDLRAGISRFTGSFQVPRTNAGQGGTVRLPDGRVLSASPWESPGVPTIPAELWDPSTGEWTVSGAMHVPGGPAVALPDGSVLVAGGIDWADTSDEVDTPMSRAELWEPDSGEWVQVADMSAPRTGHALIEVEGRALAISGFASYPAGSAQDSVEAFDPETRTWSTLAARMPVAHAGAVAMLRDGRVLVAGGTTQSGGYQRESAEVSLYDPVAERWAQASSMLEPRAQHALTVLRDGRVLATGGAQDSFSHSTNSVELYDPASDAWTRVAPMVRVRRLHGAVLLPSGDVVVTGGYPGGYGSEIYTPCE